ncbi:cytochrome P450 [Actinotalea ferrariae CF5-4]|uniref:Cytochrome P450 n=2 Tax=Actinotalea TaxID=458839 RepID=A0A021VPT3_9CELL|nr:cytochrome P450 [Actinotalea ferrariae]EYR62045.1 cytochrome P450 [Actinotalea ferrariae CF5-4]
MTAPSVAGTRRLPHASALDTARVLGRVVVPLLARGVIVRRRAAVAMAERADADARAVALLQELRRTYGAGPLRLRLPRRMVVLLSPQHVHRVLADGPEPFSPATREKRAALSHFEPDNVLISSAEDRAERRPFHDVALDSGSALHRGSDAAVATIHEELDGLLERVDATGRLEWDDYARTWLRIVRRVTLGDGAADDEQLTDDLVALRATANWAFLHPTRRRLRRRFHERLQGHLDRAEPGSLAFWAAQAPTTPNTRPSQQVAQWLFAFDAATWAGFRALALLATHPEQLRLVRAEIDAVDLGVPQPLPRLRAVVLESLRLWPTTPAVLRETTARTQWEEGPMPEGTSILTYAPFFHRDDENLPEAHRFAPDLWARQRTEDDWPFVPFSAGPAQCPGRNVVLHTVSLALARLLRDRDVDLLDGRLRHDEDLPGTLDMFTLRFAVGPRETAAA